jgi:hypothetical protein
MDNWGPFLQHLPETVAKVNLGFLKDPIPAHELISPVVNRVRSQRVAPFQKGAVSKVGPAKRANSSSDQFEFISGARAARRVNRHGF